MYMGELALFAMYVCTSSVRTYIAKTPKRAIYAILYATKVLVSQAHRFDLTKRQIVCFGTGALIGVPVYFFVRGSGNLSLAAVARQFYQARFVRPKVRPYRTNNYYAALMRQADAQEEVTRIVQKATERQAHR